MTNPTISVTTPSLWQRIEAAEYRQFREIEREMANTLFPNDSIITDNEPDLSWVGQHPSGTKLKWGKSSDWVPPRFLSASNEAMRHVPDGPFSIVRENEKFTATVGQHECRARYAAQAIMAAVFKSM
jgi:hypothetical protein